MRREPEPSLGSEPAHVAAYLDFYRATLVEKCRALPAADLWTPRLPSRWTPLELLQHVAYMERRWFVWGFLGEPVPDPWGDSGGDPDHPWHVAEGTELEEVVELLEEQAARTRRVLAVHGLDDVASGNGRFVGQDPPRLRWICFHVLQEYARHAGHLDVVVELAVGATGE